MSEPSVRRLIDAAWRHHRSGESEQAEQHCHQVLQLCPDHAGAWNLLGILSHQRRDFESAIDHYQRAIAAGPPEAQYYSNLGVAFRLGGRSREALSSFKRAIDLDSRHCDAYFNLGNLHQSAGELVAAKPCYRRVLQINDRDHCAWNNLGDVLLRRGELDEARAALQRALQLRPKYALAQFNLANVLKAEGRFDGAETAYKRAIELQPRLVDAHLNLGNVYFEGRQFGAARECYERVLRIDSTRSTAWFGLGSVYLEQHDLERAESCYRRSLKIDRNSAKAWNGLGSAFQLQEKVQPAIECYQRSLKLWPGCASAHSNLASALNRIGEVDRAAEHYKHALVLDPGGARDRIKLATILPPMYRSIGDLNRWRARLIEQVERLQEENVSLDPADTVAPHLLFLAYQGCNDRDLMRRIGQLYRSSHVPDGDLSTRPSRDKIHVGFISRYFNNHTIGWLSQGLIANLSRESFHVTVLTPAAHDDEIGSFIRERADDYVVISNNLRQARQRIVETKLDVLYYTDIGMNGFTYSLAFSRLAPIQCVTWGHPLTTGIDTMDYFISSRSLEVADSQDHYTEQLFLAETLTSYYYRPAPPRDPKKRDHFGLSDRSHVYVCPQSLFKLHPEFDPILAEILGRDPEGVLVFIEGQQKRWTEMFLDRLRKSLGREADRVVFLPWQNRDDFLSLLMVSDVMLDPIHFGGGKTSYQGFALGVPIVTLPSKFLRGRITHAMYEKMDISECVAQSPDEYAKIALQLAGDPAFRRHVQQKIRERCPVLYEDIEALREVERFLLQAVS